MPIEYSVLGYGHLIHAIARPPVTSDEFVDYEISHAIDSRVNTSVSELLEVQPGALSQISEKDILEVLKRRKSIEKGPLKHRCGIVVSFGDDHGWDLAKFYEGMVTLHSSQVVILFGEVSAAKRWLGFQTILGASTPVDNPE